IDSDHRFLDPMSAGAGPFNSIVIDGSVLSVYIQPDTLYYFRVAVTTAGGTSAWSAAASITTLANPTIPTANGVLWLEGSTSFSAGPNGSCVDQFASGNNPIQSSGAAQPIGTDITINGLTARTLVFDGTTSWMQVPTLSLPHFTIFIVGKTSVDSCYLGSDQAHQVRSQEGGNNIALFDGANNPLSTACPHPLTSYSLMECRGDGTTVSFFQNGTACGTGTINSALSLNEMGSIAGGAGLLLHGAIAEMIVYNAAFSDADRQTVEAILLAKWAPWLS
ncbi:MAG: hypothetical protein JWO94_1276, partial [Verrucomicrobiaceae bacterium]|nr:hypothetical protein [Verrucomicrobiaceae bacterium]